MHKETFHVDLGLISNKVLQNMQLTEACKLFLIHCEVGKNLSLNTVRAYKRDLQCFQDLVGNSVLINKLDRNLVKDFIALLNKDELSKASIKRRIACIKAMFRWMELEELVTINPFHKIDLKLRLPRRLPRNIPKEELRNMLAKAKSEAGLEKRHSFILTNFSRSVTSKRQLNKVTALVIIELLIVTGLRVGEIVSIQLGHIFWLERKIRILGKGQRERYVYLPNIEILELLTSYFQLREITEAAHQYFLVNSRGDPASTHFARKLVREIALRAGITRTITPHMYRHSAACQLLEAGVDIRFVQRLLGHHSISTTEIYTHVNDTVLQDKICQANVRGGLE